MQWDAQQVKQALDDMTRAFVHLPLEAQECLLHRINGVMERRNNTSLYSLASFNMIHTLAVSCGLSSSDLSVLEIGAGKPLGMGLFWQLAGARKYTSIDRYVPVNLDKLWIERFRQMIALFPFHPQPFDIETMVCKKEPGYEPNRDRIDLIQGDFTTHPFPDETFDLIYSFAVLEHVAAVGPMLVKMHRILRPGGLTVHWIDLREHHTHLRTVPDKDTSIEFLKYSRAEWEHLYPPGSEHYINRLRAGDFRRLIADAGFEIVEYAITKQMELSEAIYEQINPEFHRYPPEELAALTVRAVLRKG